METRPPRFSIRLDNLLAATQITQPTVRIENIGTGQPSRHIRKGVTNLPTMAKRGGM